MRNRISRHGADYRVYVDTDGVVLTHVPSGTSETVAWAALTGVSLAVVDRSPLGAITYLLEHDGKTLEIPLAAAGNETLLANLQDTLPGFDNEALIEAMAMAHGFKRLWPVERADGVAHG